MVCKEIVLLSFQIPFSENSENLFVLILAISLEFNTVASENNGLNVTEKNEELLDIYEIDNDANNNQSKSSSCIEKFYMITINR